MSPELHVLLIPSWYPTQAAPLNGVFFQEQTNALHDEGIQVGVVYPDLRSLRSLSNPRFWKNRFQRTQTVENGVPTVRFHGWNVISAKLRGAIFNREVENLAMLYIKSHGIPTIIHAQSALWGGVAARNLAEKLGVPYVVTEHSSAFLRHSLRKWQKPHVRRVLADAAAILAVSPALCRELKAFAGGKAISIVPNPVDVAFFKLPPSARPMVPYRFACVAFLNENKGIDVLIRAFVREFSGDKNVYLEIGGEGPARESLEWLVKDLGVESQVRFLGLLSRQGVRELMWRSNSLVLASHKETFGVVLVEAMATGLPVIATMSGGPESIVKPGLGELVPPGDIIALAEAMRATRRRANGHERNSSIRGEILNDYSEGAFVRRMRSIYREVLT